MGRPPRRLNSVVTCMTCAYYNIGSGSGGQCRMKAPFTSFVKTPEGSKMKTVWPLVRDHDWCGDHAVVEEE